ncbi:MAG TPA: Lsr2 family protein [Pseudonocardia sp.]|nr:Lsr2 family protein [Pseudonocardia sp.]
MVKKRHLVDDLDGTTAHETVRFNVDGVEYEIDLSLSHAAFLRQTLAPFINCARRVDIAPAKKQEQNRAIRAWARRQGRYLRNRGRIPDDVVRAYHQSP